MLAHESGVARLTIYRIEHGQTDRVQMKTIRQLAATLGVTAEALTEWRQTPAPDPAAIARDDLGADEVLFASDLARLVKCGLDHLLALARTRPELLPKAIDPPIDRRPRWSRMIVERWLDGDPTAAGEPTRKRRRADTRRSDPIAANP
jgi:transcriptional regulator with XRE-family HTH domain